METSGRPTPSPQAWYAASIADFLQMPPPEVIGALAGSCDFASGELVSAGAAPRRRVFSGAHIPLTNRGEEVVLLMARPQLTIQCLYRYGDENRWKRVNILDSPLSAEACSTRRSEDRLSFRLPSVTAF